MAYFSDLSRRFYQPNTLNVGWLDGEHHFEKARPPKWMIEKLWVYCRYFLIPAGGFHECNLPNCLGPFKKVKSHLYVADRKEALREEEELREILRREDLTERVRDSFAELVKAVRQKYIKIILGTPPIPSDSPLPLGSDEIRVLGERGRVYAAPNMLYHYVSVHHYKPPKEFVHALKRGPCPPESEYIEGLRARGCRADFIQICQRMYEAQDLRLLRRKRKRCKQ